MSKFVIGARGIHGEMFLCLRRKWSMSVEDAQVFVSERGARKALVRSERRFRGILDDFCIITLEDEPVDREKAC